VRIIADACRDIVAGPVGSYQQFGFGLYLVALKETAVPIGICGLLKRESMKDIAIGFAFLERFWAKGYAYESAAAVMDYARTSLGLTRIAADRTGESRLHPGAGETGAAIRGEASPSGTGTRDEFVCIGGIRCAPSGAHRSLSTRCPYSQKSLRPES
jgi:hypothetical protein